MPGEWQQRKEKSNMDQLELPEPKKHRGRPKGSRNLNARHPEDAKRLNVTFQNAEEFLQLCNAILDHRMARAREQLALLGGDADILFSIIKRPSNNELVLQLMREELARLTQKPGKTAD
jgi:hypothetical protein